MQLDDAQWRAAKLPEVSVTTGEDSSSDPFAAWDLGGQGQPHERSCYPGFEVAACDTQTPAPMNATRWRVGISLGTTESSHQRRGTCPP